MKILLVEDDRETAETLAQTLKEYYTIEIAETGKEGEYKAQTNEYSLILLDYLLPDMDGIALCKILRDEEITTPIIMLTGNGEINNKVKALNSGIDDYVLKPIDTGELRARIEAIIRRSSSKSRSNVIAVDDLIYDIDKKEATRNNKKLGLKRKELDLLEYLMRNAGKVITRSMIFDHIWESDFDSDTNVVDVHIKYLRDEVDRNFKNKLIKTVYGYGYKIESEGR